MARGSAVERWRAALMSDELGVPALAIRDRRIVEGNASARALFPEPTSGGLVERLFAEPSRGALAAALDAGAPVAAVRLEVLQAFGPPVATTFLVLADDNEQLLLGRELGAGPADELGARLIAANAQLAGIAGALAQARGQERALRAELEAMWGAGVELDLAIAELPAGDVTAALVMFALWARMTAPAEYVAIGLGTDPGRPFEPWTVIGVSEPTLRRMGRNPRPVGVLGRVARDGEVIRSVDLRRNAYFGGLPPGHPELGRFLGVPVRHRGSPAGVLCLASPPGAAEFTAKEEREIRIVAARVGAALETAALYAATNQHRAWLHNTIDQMPAIVLLYDERGLRRASNQGIVPRAGEDIEWSDPFGNRLMLEPRDPDDRRIPVERWPLLRAMREGEVVVREEMHVRRPSRELTPIAISAAPVRGLEGGGTGGLIIIEDISDRRALDKLREEWSAVIAHDLRQPVNLIGLAAESLLADPAPRLEGAHRRTLERIEAASRRLNRMIDDLIDTSRLESQRLAIRAETVELRGFLSSIIEELAAVLAGHQLHLTVEPDLPVWIDPDRLHQVLGNLLSNAVKYGWPDTEIWIDAAPRDELVEVTITNRGPGIPPDQLPLLFSRFSRAAVRGAGGAPGLGLGLYIARGLVEAHGGRMWAESRPGETTSFHFTVRRTAQLMSEPP